MTYIIICETDITVALGVYKEQFHIVLFKHADSSILKFLRICSKHKKQNILRINLFSHTYVYILFLLEQKKFELKPCLDARVM